MQQKYDQFAHSISPIKSSVRLKPLKSLPYRNQIPLNDILKINTEMKSLPRLTLRSKSFHNQTQLIQPQPQFKIKTFNDYMKLKEKIFANQNNEEFQINKTRYPSLDKSSATMCGFWKKQRLSINEPVPPPKSFLGTDKIRTLNKKNMKSESEQTKKLVQQVKKEMMLSGVNDLANLPKPEIAQHSPLTQIMQDVIGDLNIRTHNNNLSPLRLRKMLLKNEIQIINNRIKGERACARDGHTAVLSNGIIIVFGGDRNKNSLSSLHLLDLEKLFE